MIGLAASPGTDVEPTWSTLNAACPSRARMRAVSCSNRAGHAESCSTSRIVSS